MTMLASWIGVDDHGPTSAYIVSDSRVSWALTTKFDYGRKVFASKKYPELFGYAGDVLFPSIVLSQVLEMIDSDILLSKKMDCEKKHKTIAEKICYSLSKYPHSVMCDIEIMHITRETKCDDYPEFKQYILSYSKSKGKWEDNEIPMPTQSGLLQVLGSGAKEFNDNYLKFQKNDNASTSRNVFHCFIKTLDGIKDPYCGGAPQLVGLYRKPLSTGINYGILYKGKRYLLGMEMPADASFKDVEWRNENFEICNGETKKIVPGAAKQPIPAGVI